MRIAKKTLAMLITILMILSSVGTITFAETLAPADGNAYFYFAASGLNVEAPDNFKNGFSINGSTPIYITSNIIAHTERIDKSLLTPNAVNTITIYTGNTSGVIDEALSRNEAGNVCDEFNVTTSTLNLILPNGCIVYPSRLVAYTPKDAETPLKDGHNATEYTGTGNVNLGDDSLSYAYKLDIEFDLTNVDWNPDNDMEPQLPAIKNVSLQIGAEPSQRNIVWYSTSVNDGVVQLALKSAMTGDEFPTDSATTFPASPSATGLTGYISYKATMTGLTANTAYVYRVGNADGWSDVYSFNTQSFEGDFTFLAVADPQLGQGNRFDNIQDEIAGWTDTLQKAQNEVPEAAFLASLGDQVAKTYIDGQFDAFFSPEELKSFALAAVPGNHDVGANYTPHYNMPNVSTLGVQTTMGAGSGNYWFTYGDALFMTINGISSAYDEHIQFLEETIEANPNAKWKIVMIHYGFYGATDQSFRTELIIKLREALAPVFSRLCIDVVLNGHEHCYARSYLVNGSEQPNTESGGDSVTDPDPREVLYMTLSSASGTDYVAPQEPEELPCTAKVVQDYIPNFSKVDITAYSFKITTYRTSDLAVVDTFTINRSTTPTVTNVLVSPNNALVQKGKSQAFNAEILGYNSPSDEVNWNVSGNESSETTISAEGVLTVGSNETSKSLVVTATSAVNSSKQGSVTVTIITEDVIVNASKGAPCTLADGTVVDTTYPGYQSIKGTDGKTYRVNVGTYGVAMYDDMQGHSTVMSTTTPGTGTTTKGSVDNAAITFANYNVTSETLNQRISQRFENDGTNVYAAFGPDYSSWNAKWTLSTERAVPYRFSFDMKLDELDLTNRSSGYVPAVAIQVDGANWFTLYPYVDAANNNADLQARVYGIKNNSDNTGYSADSSTGGYVAIDANTSVDNNIFSSDWFNVEILVNEDYTYNLYINGKQITKDVNGDELDGLKFMESMGAFSTAAFALRNAGTTTVTFVDNLKVTDDNLLYPSMINGEGLTDSVYSGIKGGEVTVPVTMSDATTQDFTAAYSLTDAQSAAAGTYNVEAAIPGFSEKVTVAVTVMESAAENKTINACIGDTIEFPAEFDSMSVIWKNYSGSTVTAADTGAIGRKLYTGALADGRTVTYTVNVGEYNLKLEDKMSDHTNTTNDDGVATVDPGAGDGLALEMLNNTTDKNSSTVESDSTGNTYLKVTDKTPANNAKWLVEDTFNGDYKVSYDIKIENAATGTSYFPYRFMVLDTNGRMIASAALYVSNDNKLYMRGNKYSGSLTSYNVTSLAGWSVTDSVGSMEDWCSVEILVHTQEQTFDVIFEGTPTHTGLPFLANDYYGEGTTDGALAAVSFDRRQAATAESTTATAMLDNVEIYTYNYFADELDDVFNVVTAVGKSTVEVPLVLSNGDTRSFTMTLPCDVSSIAQHNNVDAEIAGFDGTVKANVKVCNYQINGVNLKSGNEFITAPVAGGTVETVNIKKLTDSSAQMAILVLYSQYEDIKAIKTIDISSLVKDSETDVPVDMTLPENTASGDYIRVYVWDSGTSLQPLDMVTDLFFDYGN